MERSVSKKRNLFVCEYCLAGIESREGFLPVLVHNKEENITEVWRQIDEDDEESACDWCRQTGCNTLYELV